MVGPGPTAGATRDHGSVMSTILVTGAHGFIGSHTIPALLEAGHRVVALTRTTAGGEALLRRLTDAQRGQVDRRLGDVTRPESLTGAFEGVDAVLHLVAIPRDSDGGASL